jgi:hypothetical protein
MQIVEGMSGREIVIHRTGGFVIHKLRVPGSGSNFSAWFNRDGEMTVVERIDSMDRCYYVTPDARAWKHLAQIGERYAAAVYAQ